MAIARRKLTVMSVTEAAAERVREIIENADEPVAGVRVGVKNGGCAGMSYTMDLAREAPAGDERIDEHGVTVFVEPKAVLFLLGTEMDFERTTLKTGFVFRNPNQVSACGCGESVSLKPADPEAIGA
ncbi:Fe-S cluster assembly scaffold SufA [Oharaeibacter diazotrophicus]|uniref:Iron-sulfur cluster assembly protein n=1 Tax=Oharaeibacter diazotrophicus TaxID=1920512 RepID=A0A4R6RJM9_9HYPH|nr:Fe-S cluster assembly scaffold SufA [Oharaeibacter diazotrophicus]TDP86680.1 iron-sulfur cluster assembly protein [Oharaeibacter diazotrophicus]BBE71378.1 iron-binding protein IscA [Pleomorphomonas sp. SM30]GLS78135.1 Fe-S cluster assembly scaffold SufA [Oharaeibacter diazotrophicus]